MSTAANVFDRLLNSTCTIMSKGSGASEGYNQPSQVLSPVAGMTDLPCRLSTMNGGKEYRSGKEYSINSFRVFLRPPVGAQITTRHWVVVTDQSGNTHTLNLIAVNDPSGMGHHLELIGQEVTP
jgi:head-tail adaptor